MGSRKPKTNLEMPALSKLVVLGLSSQAAGFVLPMAPMRTTSRNGGLCMGSNEPTRDSAPGKAQFDNGMSGWKPPGGGGGGAHTLGGQYSATDTPDFLPEEGSEAAKKAAGIGYMDGIKGSQHDPNRKKSTGPELANALESNPDIYVPEVLEVHADASLLTLPPAKFNINKLDFSQTDFDLEMFCGSTEEKQLAVDVAPVCMTFEDFFCGFTKDSHPSFSVTPTTGTLERRGGPTTRLTVTCKPKGASGELVGYLCVIMPDEKDFSTFYKITCMSR